VIERVTERKSANRTRTDTVRQSRDLARSRVPTLSASWRSVGRKTRATAGFLPIADCAPADRARLRVRICRGSRFHASAASFCPAAWPSNGSSDPRGNFASCPMVSGLVARSISAARQDRIPGSADPAMCSDVPARQGSNNPLTFRVAPAATICSFRGDTQPVWMRSISMPAPGGRLGGWSPVLHRNRRQQRGCADSGRSQDRDRAAGVDPLRKFRDDERIERPLILSGHSRRVKLWAAFSGSSIAAHQSCIANAVSGSPFTSHASRPPRYQ
jgi:hypothetical protein